MITFRAMKVAEFPEYRDYFIRDYAEEIAANFGHSLEQSRTIASKELTEDLPQDAATPDHTLLCIEASESDSDSERKGVGYLWYKLFDAGETAFILDFVLFEQFRGQGDGKAAMIALEERLLQTGVTQIKLRVAFKNDRARHLYEAVGFAITGFNMSKVLK